MRYFGGTQRPPQGHFELNNCPEGGTGIMDDGPSDKIEFSKLGSESDTKLQLEATQESTPQWEQDKENPDRNSPKPSAPKRWRNWLVLLTFAVGIIWIVAKFVTNSQKEAISRDPTPSKKPAHQNSSAKS